jgi:hypothetical protein
LKALLRLSGNFAKGWYEGKTDESYENEKEASNAMFFFFRRPRVEDDDAF